MRRLQKLPILITLVFFSCDKEENLISISESSFQFKWINSLNGPSEEDEIDAIASDNQGNVYLSGKFENELKVEGQTQPLVSNGMADIMVVKYNQDGIWQWSKKFGGIGEDNIFDADCDKQGNLILRGYFQGTVQFGSFELTSLGGFDMVLLKISPNGEVINAIRLGGTGNDGGNEGDRDGGGEGGEGDGGGGGGGDCRRDQGN